MVTPHLGTVILPTSLPYVRSHRLAPQITGSEFLDVAEMTFVIKDFSKDAGTSRPKAAIERRPSHNSSALGPPDAHGPRPIPLQGSEGANGEVE